MAALASCNIVGLARAWVARDTVRYRFLSLQLFAVSAILGSAGVLVALLAGNKLLTLLFRPDYGSNSSVLARIMVAGALGYVVSGTRAAARKLMQQIPLLMSTAGVTTLFSWYLVPKRGLEGAAEAAMLGSFFQLACNTALMARISNDAELLRARESEPNIPASERANAG